MQIDKKTLYLQNLAQKHKTQSNVCKKKFKHNTANLNGI